MALCTRCSGLARDCPRVDQDKVTVLPRDDGGESRPVYAFHGAQLDRAAGHERAGIAATDDDARLAFLDAFNGANHRSVLLAPQRLHRFVIHGDDFRGMKDLDGRMVAESALGK